MFAVYVMQWDLLPIYSHGVRHIFAFNIRWMPESARWLIANGKLEQAQMNLKKCARMNQTEEFTDTLKPEVSKIQMIFKTTELIKKKNSLVLGIIFYCLVHDNRVGIRVKHDTVKTRYYALVMVYSSGLQPRGRDP